MISIDTLPNGLTVIIEEMPHFESAAFEIGIPGGLIIEDERLQGESLILADLTDRGAGDLNSKEMSDAFERVGVRHSASSGLDRFFYRGSLLAEHLPQALKLTTQLIRNPRFPKEEIPNIKSVLLQDLASLDDNPSRKAMVEMSHRYYPAPYSRTSLGTESGIEATTLSDVKNLWKRCFSPRGSYLSVAGNVERGKVLDTVNSLFSDWKGEGCVLPPFADLPPHNRYHLKSDSAQMQIVLAYPSARFAHPSYYTAKIASEILSGGMFGRLFIEVREKRGLCYSVNCRHSGNKHAGAVFAYAGTTPERADETLSVMLEVLRGLRGTVTEEELLRAKANLKASLIIGEESSGSRSASNGGDFWLLGRVRTLDEIASAIDSVTTKDIDRYMTEFPTESFMLVTLGPKELQ